jgi:copper chaperone CopZ
MMRTKILSLTALFIFGASSVFASVKSEKIKVNGNCGMCKSRIEKAVNSMEGIESTNWNKETQELQVKYDEEKASTMQIQTSLAMAGHDTELFSTNDKKYAELPNCCQYERKENRKVLNHGKAMEGCSSVTKSVSECGHGDSSSSGSCCEK